MAVAKIEGGVGGLAVTKTEDIAVYIAVCVAVRSWGKGIRAVAVVTAKIGDRDIDIATRKNKVITVLAIDVVKTENERNKIITDLIINVIIIKTEKDLFSIELKRIETETEGGKNKSIKNIIKSENKKTKTSKILKK